MQPFSSLVKTIKEDLDAHRGEWSRPGFHTLAVYRFGRWTKSIKSRAVRAPLSALAKSGHVFCRNFYGIELPFEAKVGRWVTIEHQGSIVVHGNAEIGDLCILRQGCTLGMKDVNRPYEAPTLGKGVSVGAGATILGNVVVGDNCNIGANSVVTKSVPEAVTVVGCNKWLDFGIQASSSLPDDLPADQESPYQAWQRTGKIPEGGL